MNDPERTSEAIQRFLKLLEQELAPILAQQLPGTAGPEQKMAVLRACDTHLAEVLPDMMPVDYDAETGTITYALRQPPKK
jgi:hypothetical protein